MNRVIKLHYLLTLIIWCDELLLLIILNSLFTDSSHFPSVFTHGFIQLFFNAMNRIKIINQVWLGLLPSNIWNQLNFVKKFSRYLLPKLIMERTEQYVKSVQIWERHQTNIIEVVLACLFVTVNRLLWHFHFSLWGQMIERLPNLYCVIFI